MTVASSQASSVCSGPMALDEQRAALRVEAERERGPPPSRACAGAAGRGRGCSSARGSRRCSRSPRTRTGAGRSCGSRRGRCRGGERPTAGSRRRSGAGAPARAPRRARGPARSSSSASVADGPHPSAHARRRLPFRRCRDPPEPSHERRSAARRRPRCGDRRPRGRARPARAGRARCTRPTACALVLTGVAVRDVDAGASSAACRPSSLTDAPAHLVADDEADVIVELMGGDEPAHTLIAAALSMGKSVVTANKHVIAHHGAGARGDRPARPAPRSASRPRSAAGSRSSARSRRTSPPTGSSACAAS